MLTTVGLLVVHLFEHDRSTFLWVGGLFAAIALTEIFFFERLAPGHGARRNTD